VLVELSVMEQRYQAVLAVVQDGWKVVEVAERLGVTRQTIHNWIARYEEGGLAALTDHSRRPNSCPHQTSAEVEALICELRREHPGWGPRRIEHQLARRGVEPVPGRSSIYRCLKRHRLIELRRRRRRRDEFRRWERERPMQLWQMDVMGGVELDDGTELKVVTGIDDHSRFCVAAGLVTRAESKLAGNAHGDATHRVAPPLHLSCRPDETVWVSVTTLISPQGHACTAFGSSSYGRPLPARNVRALTRVAVSSSEVPSAVDDSFHGLYPEVCIAERAIAREPHRAALDVESVIS
jgi:transposase